MLNFALRTRVVIAAVALTVGCASPPPAPTAASSPPPDATAGSSGAGRLSGESGPLLDPISLIGTWSFDRSCASEDGMSLAADGTAGTDLGSGTWAVDVDHRLVVIVREQEMGREPDPKAERLVLQITAAKPVGDDLVGRLAPVRPGQPTREINAKRCP